MDNIYFIKQKLIINNAIQNYRLGSSPRTLFQINSYQFIHPAPFFWTAHKSTNLTHTDESFDWLITILLYLVAYKYMA